MNNSLHARLNAPERLAIWLQYQIVDSDCVIMRAVANTDPNQDVKLSVAP